jgi:glycerophosphoryl diester phosphodiesterase
VVHHDSVVHARHPQRLARKSITELSEAELGQFPLADGARIPSLSETLDLVGDRAVVYVEIKASNIELLVTRCIRESRATCAVHSFDHRAVKNVKAILPAVRTGVLEASRQIDPVASLLAASADDLWQEVDSIDEETVVRAHSVGARVIAWTANEALQWKRLHSIGVDGICTDRIAELGTFRW